MAVCQSDTVYGPVLSSKIFLTIQCLVFETFLPVSAPQTYSDITHVKECEGGGLCVKMIHSSWLVLHIDILCNY